MAWKTSEFDPLEQGIYDAKFMGVGELKWFDWSAWPFVHFQFGVPGQLTKEGKPKTVTASVLANQDLVDVVKILAKKEIPLGGGPEGLYQVTKKVLEGVVWHGKVRVNWKGFVDQLGQLPTGAFNFAFVGFTHKAEDTGLSVFRRYVTQKGEERCRLDFELAVVNNPMHEGVTHRDSIPASFKITGPGGLDTNTNARIRVFMLAGGMTEADFAGADFATEEAFCVWLEGKLVAHAKAGRWMGATIDEHGRLKSDGLVPVQGTPVAVASPAKGNQVVELLERIATTMYGAPTPVVKQDANQTFTDKGLALVKMLLPTVVDTLPMVGIEKGAWPPSAWGQMGVANVTEILLHFSTMPNERLMLLIGESEVTKAALVAELKDVFPQFLVPDPVLEPGEEPIPWG